MNNNMDFKGLIFSIANMMASSAFSFFLTRTLTNNSDALNLVANVFSILSGFLLLVITMSGENSTISGNLSLLDSVNQEKRFIIRFNKYYSLFLLYILTLALIFIYYLLSKDNPKNGKIESYVVDGVGYSIAFLSCFSFIQSIFIPLKIKELFKEKRELNE